MDVQMTNCVECGRLIASDATRDHCDVCFVQFDLDLGLIQDTIAIHGNISPSEIAKETHLSLNRIEHILEHREILVGEASSDSVCSKCNSKPALPHAQFCLACQLAMYKSLGDEAYHSAQHYVHSYEKPDTSVQSLRSTMDSKRARAGFNRMTPNTSVKGNRKR